MRSPGGPVLGAASLAAVMLAGCVTTSRPPELKTVNTPRRTYQVEHHVAETGDGRRLHFVEVGDKTARAVVFVHGTPGNWRAFEGYLARPELVERFRLVSVDRLGFGGSEPGKAETSLERQAASLAPLLASLSSSGKPILVGHSYSGPVIAKVAMDHPDLAGGLVMVAPSIDPELEKLRWYNHLASWRLFSWAIPREWLVSNREILPLRKELAAIAGGWSRIAAKTIVIQGDLDTLVPPQNADFAARVLPPGSLVLERIPAAGHFVLWQQPELIVRAILSFGA